MRTPIGSGEWGADSLWHKVAMQLLKLLTLLVSHDHLLTVDWMRGDLTWAMCFVAGEQAGCCDGDSIETHGRWWEFTQEKNVEVSRAVPEVIKAYQTLLHLAFLNVISFHSVFPTIQGNTSLLMVPFFEENVYLF